MVARIDVPGKEVLAHKVHRLFAHSQGCRSRHLRIAARVQFRVGGSVDARSPTHDGKVAWTDIKWLDGAVEEPEDEVKSRPPV